MNAIVRMNLVTTPRPVDADDTAVILERGAWRVAWWRQGRIPEPFGPVLDSAREACAAARLVRETVLS
jgi:hypothetical protein